MMGGKHITNSNFRHTSDGNTNFKNSIDEEENFPPVPCTFESGQVAL